MVRLWSHLLLAASLLLVQSACVFTVDTEQTQSADTGPTMEEDADVGDSDINGSDTNDSNADTTDPPDAPELWVEITGPETQLITNADTSVIFEVDCTPSEWCEEHLECRYSRGGETSSWQECGTTFLVIEAPPAREGILTASARVTDRNDPENVVADATEVITLLDLTIEVEDLDLDESNPFSHDHLGETSVTCHHPYCELNCSWDLPDWDPADIPPVDCTSGELLSLTIPDDQATEQALLIEACSTSPELDGLTEHCRDFSVDFVYADPTWQTVEMGGSVACAILGDHSLWCWGKSEFNLSNDPIATGILGIGDADSHEPLPRRVSFADGSSPRWRDISLGTTHACAITLEDDLYCWGLNATRKVVPTSSTVVFDRPALVDNTYKWSNVATAFEATCATTNEGELFCWGDDYLGILGVGDDALPNDLNQVSLPDDAIPGDYEPQGWVDVAMGAEHACAIMENAIDDSSAVGQQVVYCWGEAARGQVGIQPSQNYFSTPQFLEAPLRELTTLEVSAGSFHSCIITHDGSNHEAYCWGNNEHGQLGHDHGDGSSPWAVTNSQGLIAISSRAAHNCALDSSGYAGCWGNNDYYQLGTGSTDPELEPTPVNFGDPLLPLELAEISTGGGITCAITADRSSLYCWGTGDVDLIGDEDVPTPTQFSWPYAR